MKKVKTRALRLPPRRDVMAVTTQRQGRLRYRGVIFVSGEKKKTCKGPKGSNGLFLRYTYPYAFRTICGLFQYLRSGKGFLPVLHLIGRRPDRTFFWVKGARCSSGPSIVTISNAPADYTGNIYIAATGINYSVHCHTG